MTASQQSTNRERIVDLGFEKDTEEMDCGDTSTKKHKQGLKKMLKRKSLRSLNDSVSKKAMNRSYSKKLNLSINSVQKQTLRSNNRALAVNLQRTKQELRAALEVNYEMHAKLQEAEMKVVTLERVSGLKNSQIEEEVNKRVEVKQRALQEILSKLSENLYAATNNLSDAFMHCMQGSRQSSIGSRKTSSVGSMNVTDNETDLNSSTYQRSIYAQTASSMQIPRESLPMSDNFTSGHKHDMSVIAEQSMIADKSVLLEDIEAPANLLNSVMESSYSCEADEELAVKVTTEKKTESTKDVKDFISKLPQRIPKSDVKRVKKSKDQREGDNERVVSKHVNKEDRERRGTFVISEPEKDKNLPQITISGPTAVSDDFVSKDKRKTFLLPKSPAGIVPPEIDSHEDFTAQCDINGQNDQTTYFNTDMEMTEVINFTQQIEFENKNMEATDENDGIEYDSNKVENDGMKSTESIIREVEEEGIKKKNHENDRLHTEGKSLTKENKLEKGKEGNADKPPKSVVEMKVSKPGKILFSASRKQLDGSRQPVPINVKTKSKQKGKVKLSKSADVKHNSEPKSLANSTTTKTSNKEAVFDFENRSPTITLDPKSIYDLSMNESLLQTKVKSQVESHPGDIKTKKSDVKLLPDNDVYFVPLAKGSPDVANEPRRQSRRSRSRPRSYKETSSDEEDKDTAEISPKVDHVGKEKNDGQSIKRRTRSQSRGRSSKKHNSEHRDESEEMVYKKKKVDETADPQKTRGKSQTRINDSTPTDDLHTEGQSFPGKDDVSDLLAVEHSKGRSRSRGVPEDISQLEVVHQSQDSSITMEREEISEKLDVKKTSRGRSKTRKDVTKEEDEHRRGRSKTRKAKSEVDEEEIQGRGRSRSRKKDNVEHAEAKSPHVRSGKSKSRKAQETEASHLESEHVEIEKTNQDKTSSLNPEKNIVRRSGRSKSRRRHGSKHEESKKQNEYLQNETEWKQTEKTTENCGEAVETQINDHHSVDCSEVIHHSEQNPRKSAKNFLQSLVKEKSSESHLLEKNSTASFLKSMVLNQNGDENHETILKNQSKDFNKEKKELEKNLVSSNFLPPEGDNSCHQKINKECNKLKDISNLQEDQDRLSQFVCSRGSKKVVVEDDEDITFSDFDKLYKKMAEKNVRENNKEIEAPPCIPQAEQVDKMFKTPVLLCKKGEKSASKSKTERKKSSKKKSSERKDKENPKESAKSSNISSSRAKLESLKKRLTEIGSGKSLLDTEKSVSQSLPTSPSESDMEPERKRQRRGAVVNYKEKNLNCKMRREDLFHE